MLRTDKPIYKVILVFNLLLITAAVVLSIISICSEGATATRILSSAIRLLALLFAGFYIISGYSKNASAYYKIFGIIYALGKVIGIISSINHMPTVPEIICDILIIIGILVLTFVKNLGKTASFIICAVLVLLQITLLIIAYVLGNPLIVKINMYICIDLACLFGIMTYAKYLDKVEREGKKVQIRMIDFNKLKNMQKAFWHWQG